MRERISVIEAVVPMASAPGIRFSTVHVELDPYGVPEVVSVDGMGLAQLRSRLERDARSCTMREKGCRPEKGIYACYICRETREKIALAELLRSKRGSAAVMQALRHATARALEGLMDRLRAEARMELLGA